MVKPQTVWGFTWTKASQQIYLTFFANIQNVVVDNWAVTLDMFNLDARLWTQIIGTYWERICHRYCYLPSISHFFVVFFLHGEVGGNLGSDRLCTNWMTSASSWIPMCTSVSGMKLCQYCLLVHWYIPVCSAYGQKLHFSLTGCILSVWVKSCSIWPGGWTSSMEVS